MQNFCAEIRTLLNDVAHWIILDPAFADVEFPPKVSRDYLTHNSRIGKNMVWVDEGHGSARETQPMGGSLMDGRVTIYCYSRAKSRLDADILAAEAKSAAMREQASAIIKDHWNALTGAFTMRIVETDNWGEQGVDPWFFVKALVVQPQYEI